ncbi:MAG: energy-coupling factor transporter transmembrane component T [Candidatus Krumholzibacteria bacterium]|nr:energy-coupling factor transporter transmembrane component T [Candidatus Krumholzibacteria bacterium]MDP6669193.1 energy-coupling factor transporter transmembrane component T [Candidatus Krumholzibacteria bacterium]MDP6797671.1 energy-coupling factor transporter transmembrane component T [Candidatus Krumholzibacteria bacterium]MDP7021247.1 energy-coupling factor transporter transmembrane component T [Candidatus Krumholzibacteria bacterium]
MKRPVFPASPFHGVLSGRAESGTALFLAFLFFSVSIARAASLGSLGIPALALFLFHLFPSPSFRSLRMLPVFLPLLVLASLFSLLEWTGMSSGVIPWSIRAGAIPQSLLQVSRFLLWILLVSRCLELFSPLSLMSRLPRGRRWARLALMPILAFSFLDLFFAEAHSLRSAWLARGGGGRKAHWPSLLLPLFRGMLSRAEQLSESLAMRRFPDSWAGSSLRPLQWRDLWSPMLGFLCFLFSVRGGGG